MTQAISGEKPITIEGQKYRIRTQVVYQDGLGTSGTLSTTQPIRYVVQYLPEKSTLNPVPDWTNLGERDTTNQNNWIFTNVAGAGFRRELIKNGANSLTKSLDDATSNALSKSSGLTKQQADQILQVAPNVAPTVVDPNQPTSQSLGGAPPEPIKIDEIESDYIEDEYENLVYPTGLKDYGQDFITFSAIAYGTREFAPSANAYLLTPGLGERKTKIKIRGSVTLPIQPSITDNNTVQWGGEDLNAISAAFSSLSYAAANNPSQAVSDFITEVENQLKKDSSISPAVRLYLAGKAVGVNGLLSRVGGAVLNPNLELLFQGPQLRPFNFNFRLSPRDNDEATQVRKIIRYFKQNMSVKTTADNIFLKAPNVFDIKYVRGKSIDRNGKVINPIDPHPSLNKIKRCALVSCSVDYTPDGTYMTFADSSATMTSYSISLQFQELEPVTERDYKRLDKSTIGY